jgi:arylsulfatase A-like enzyme
MQPYIYIQNGMVVNTDLEQIEGRRDEGIYYRHGDAEKGFDFYDVLPRLTRQAMRFIREASLDSKPFFLYYPLTAPHTPYMPLPEFQGRSGAGRYGDFVVQVDYHVGQLLELIDSMGVAGNTLFIMTSDNGSHWKPGDIDRYDHRGNYHFRGMKSDVWEGGHRVPFLVRWPEKIERGSVSDRLVCLNDLLATCAELTGQELEWNSGEDSFSFLSALTGEFSTREERQILVNQSLSPVRSIRRDNYKLILDKSSGGWSKDEIKEGPPMQLYDLASDPGEKRNLYDSLPEKVKELQDLLNMYDKEGRSRSR